MDLQIYQRQMCQAVKKYINFLSTKQQASKEKMLERDCLELLRDIIVINEKQKSVISALRMKEKTKNPNKPSARSKGAQNGELNIIKENSKTDLEDSEEGRGKPCPSNEENYTLNFVNFQNVDENRNTANVPSSMISEENSMASETFDPSQADQDEKKLQDFHELITSNEFMHSLGLLTIFECDDLLKNRKERQRKNAFSHVFCPAIWVKQESKRKKRDWLLSTSPPQLRRKGRPGSLPSSQQPSRSTSPLEQGSCSPTSSFTPPSPQSPGSVSSAARNASEVCPVCKTKGANSQCDGCGVFFHPNCLDLSAVDFSSDWLCSTCESRGLRASAYKDPLHTNFNSNGKGIPSHQAKFLHKNLSSDRKLDRERTTLSQQGKYKIY